MKIVLEKRILSTNKEFMDSISDKDIKGSERLRASFQKEVNLPFRPFKGDLIRDNKLVPFRVDCVEMTPINPGYYPSVAVQNEDCSGSLKDIMDFHKRNGWVVINIPPLWFTFMEKNK